jgi:hypothetical protein
VPPSPSPSVENTPKMDIKVYDQMSKYLIDNPLYPTNPNLMAKLESIGIGTGKTPSVTANETIQKALEAGITEGQKLIDARAAKLGSSLNGWDYNLEVGTFGTDC